MKGKVIIFSAPSGSGKSSIINKLTAEYGLQGRFSISATSRAPRGVEVDGVHYYFLSESDFRQRIEKGDFLEYEEVYPGLFYGTLKSEVDSALEQGENVILDIDVKGAMRVKEIYRDQAITLFIQPPSIEELRRRLESRGTDAAEKIEQRLKRAKEELSYAPFYDHKVVNDELEGACQKVSTILNRFLKGEKRVLLYPGSFNPLHVGHIGLANFIIEEKCEQFDELWFMLTPKSPFKRDEEMLSDSFRADWINAIISDYHKVKLSLDETELPEPHYTYHTILHLKKKYPLHQFTLLIGSDSLESFNKWYRSQDLLQEIDILVYPRPHHRLNELPLASSEKVEVLYDAPMFEISSTIIRKLVKEGKALPFLLGIDMDQPIYKRLTQEILKLD